VAYLAGLVAFALTIFISVCLHEAGHMAAAKSFGMKVTQYFAGFGPRLWSFRRGETEYGLRGIPLGGFVKIVGMTPQDEVEPGDEERAMWRFPVWKRTIVLLAGSATHFALAILAIWIMAMTMGLPSQERAERAAASPPTIEVLPCAVIDAHRDSCLPTDPASPAAAAGLATGDRITAVNGTPVTLDNAITTIQGLPWNRPATVTVDRGGQSIELQVKPVLVQRPTMVDGAPTGAVKPVSAMGVGVGSSVKVIMSYNPVSAVGATGDYTAMLAKGTLTSLQKFPQKIPKLWTAITGGERDPETPVSVVGISRLGGEAVEHGLWDVFLQIFIGFNFFIGVFNLLPLLPVDGGHIAIIWFEKVRSWVYRLLHRPDPGRVDYMKLMPVTYAVILVFGAITVLTIGADIVNPVTLFPR